VTSHFKDTQLGIQTSQFEQATSSTDNTIIPAEQDQLEMMKNAAYGPLKWTTTK
jgi:hypothetical protein